jgi:hypothetical protein
MQKGHLRVLFVSFYILNLALAAKVGSLLQTLKLHGQGVADAVEGIVDLLAEGGHNSDYDDSDERENDRVLNETLAFFFRSE